MKRRSKDIKLPIAIQKDGEGFYFVQCPLFSECYTQGKTLDESIKNIREIIDLALEEQENQEIVKQYKLEELSLHTTTV